MTYFVAGASGATGRLLVEQLLARGGRVRVLVRTAGRLPEPLLEDDRVEVIESGVLEISAAELARHVDGCLAVASCLGHTLSLKGIFGPPRRLVTQAVHRLVEAIRANRPSVPVRFVLMNTAGNSNRDLDEPLTGAERLFLAVLRRVLPPHADNEEAADYLRTRVCPKDLAVEWAVVRPDTLIDTAEVTRYVALPSPARSAIFDPGKTSRLHVAHFMADLMTGDTAWNRWKGQMPVIYDEGWDRSGKGRPASAR